MIIHDNPIVEFSSALSRSERSTEALISEKALELGTASNIENQRATFDRPAC